MFTLQRRTLVAFLTGIALTLITGFALYAIRADAAPGDTDATFVPITPCRLVDTRPAPFRVGPNGTFGADHTQTIAARGTNGNCTIPNDAVGLSLNVTAVDATQATFLTFWPDGTRPTASNLNPAPGQPPTPNAVTTNLSGSGSFMVFNRFGTVHMIVDVNGYYTKTSLQALATDVATLEAGNAALQGDVATLEAGNAALQADVDALEVRIAALETLTESQSIETVDGQPTVRFTGVNVQVVSGSGDTMGAVNGLGNLIVGYNENESDIRTGSHNLVIGRQHSYSSFGGLIAGANNTVTGPESSVVGGFSNIASGAFSTVTGGIVNTASGSSSSVSGGDHNVASGTWSSVSGGLENTASANYASVFGGDRYLCDAVGAVACGEGVISPVD